MTIAQHATVVYKPESQEIICQGNWDATHLPTLKSAFKKISWPTMGELAIDGQAISKMDSAGAWLLETWQKQLEQHGITVHLQNFSDEHQTLFTIVKKNSKKIGKLPALETLNWLAGIGKHSLQQFNELLAYLAFVGHLAVEALRITRHPKHIRWNAVMAVIYSTGFQALPIIALLSFMIGIVIAYQMGLQLRNYGANIYIVDLQGLAVLREFGPLLTAIMVAGRTGSSFTAQIGMMKLNQEIDALDTMGVTPAELLILPKLVALFITLPLLTMWADVFGVLGGMVMADNLLNITWFDFLHRFAHVIPLRSFLIGIGKAPVFALIVASIGCFQGMQVRDSADSLGRNTTKSVVLAIFFIIVADAIFSVMFSKLKL